MSGTMERASMTADDASIVIPLDDQGAPDLQALVRLCGGYDKISPAHGRRGIAPMLNGSSAAARGSGWRRSACDDRR